MKSSYPLRPISVKGFLAHSGIILPLSSPPRSLSGILLPLFPGYANLSSLMLRIAALFVLPNGPYSHLPLIEPWDELRDARLYSGPFPVIAHPPCERWGRYWSGGPSARIRRVKGDDNGCFASALSSVRAYSGILEHPAASSAWSAFGLAKPPRSGGWILADSFGGHTCCVDQGHYGHKAQKATWLYAVNLPNYPALEWGKSSAIIRLDDGFHSTEERKRAIKTGICQRLSKKQRKETPLKFRDLLISLVLGDY